MLDDSNSWSHTNFIFVINQHTYFWQDSFAYVFCWRDSWVDDIFDDWMIVWDEGVEDVLNNRYYLDIVDGICQREIRFRELIAFRMIDGFCGAGGARVLFWWGGVVRYGLGGIFICGFIGRLMGGGVLIICRVLDAFFVRCLGWAVFFDLLCGIFGSLG